MLWRRADGDESAHVGIKKLVKEKWRRSNEGATSWGYSMEVSTWGDALKPKQRSGGIARS